jgi:hypothetical protein
MKSEWKVWGSLASSALLLTSAMPVLAQQKSAPEQNIVITRQRVSQGPDDPQGPPPPPPDTFMFVSSEMNFDGQLVKGAPYSAQAVTENTQTLADGNRIVNKSTSSVYRDGEGRTRREHTLTALGGFAAGADAPQTISINDPVAGVNYALDPRSKTAHKMAPMRFNFKFVGPPDGEPRVPGAPEAPGVMAPAPGRGEIRIERAPAPGAMAPAPGRVEILERTIAPPAGTPGEQVEGQQQVFMRHAPEAGVEGVVMQWHGARKHEAKTEALGKQQIEGVEAEGTRTTVTIPAGEIGNERAIEMISERWFSPDLKVVVMTRHSDPRFGETSYRLTNISRSEPAKSLFEVPADYTIKEASMGGQHIQKMRMRKPGAEQ